MALRLGDIDFHAWLGTSWGLLFSHRDVKVLGTQLQPNPVCD
ncbi:hypothetical protein [Marinobacter sp. ELB17]|nr:hypothetical protein [Marinobacter sp. ELB17]EAZ97794.1 hypothetical protein MELB17_12937 [Marinobacter sp. ELB17]